MKKPSKPPSTKAAVPKERSLASICDDVDAGKPVSRKEAEAVVRAVTKRCRGAISVEGLKAKALALKAGKLALAQSLDSSARKPCGADFNDTILANPLDGQVHEYACPKCGLEDRYRAPNILTD